MKKMIFLLFASIVTCLFGAAPPTLSSSSQDLAELPSLTSYESGEHMAVHAKEFEEAEAKRFALMSDAEAEQRALKERYKALDRELQQQPHVLKELEKKRVAQELWKNLDMIQSLGGGGGQKARTSLDEFLLDPNPVPPVPKFTVASLKDMVLYDPNAFGGFLLKLLEEKDVESPKTDK